MLLEVRKVVTRGVGKGQWLGWHSRRASGGGDILILSLGAHSHMGVLSLRKFTFMIYLCSICSSSIEN